MVGEHHSCYEGRSMSKRVLQIYVTGKIDGMTKDEVEQLVYSKGFGIGPFSGKTDLLVYGERPGMKKLDKAKALRIRVISWDEFLKENP